eukprot:TRINITY_DN1390_c0_g1_i2.p1 TRINITY_DN1390_c0_g1~~TRINITY_DN1390_c0_g1_i2.p1  ORF type:complete len:288 (+),score=38.62 TRINITY_DN1390_c0_g1_i2:1047-1910(+)
MISKGRVQPIQFKKDLRHDYCLILGEDAMIEEVEDYTIRSIKIEAKPIKKVKEMFDDEHMDFADCMHAARYAEQKKERNFCPILNNLIRKYFVRSQYPKNHWTRFPSRPFNVDKLPSKKMQVLKMSLPNNLGVDQIPHLFKQGARDPGDNLELKSIAAVIAEAKSLIGNQVKYFYVIACAISVHSLQENSCVKCTALITKKGPLGFICSICNTIQQNRVLKNQRQGLFTDPTGEVYAGLFDEVASSIFEENRKVKLKLSVKLDHGEIVYTVHHIEVLSDNITSQPRA